MELNRGVEFPEMQAALADALNAYNQRFLNLKAKRHQLDSIESLRADLDDEVKAKLRDDARALARLKQQLMRDAAAFHRDQAAAARLQAALSRAASWADAGAELARAGDALPGVEGACGGGGGGSLSGSHGMGGDGSNGAAVTALFAMLHRGGQRSWAVGQLGSGGSGNGSGSSSRRQSDAMSSSSNLIAGRRRSSAADDCPAAAILRDGRGPLEAGAGPLARTLSARAPLSPAPGGALARVPESEYEGAGSAAPSPLPSPRAAYTQWQHEEQQEEEGAEWHAQQQQQQPGSRPISRRGRQLLQRLQARPPSSSGGSVAEAFTLRPSLPTADGGGGGGGAAAAASAAPPGPLALSLAMRRSCDLSCQPGADEDEAFRQLLAEALAGGAPRTAALPPPPPPPLSLSGARQLQPPRSYPASPIAAAPPSLPLSPASLSPRVHAAVAAAAATVAAADDTIAAAAGPAIATWGSGLVAAAFPRTLSSHTITTHDGQLSPARTAAGDPAAPDALAPQRAWSSNASGPAALPVPSLGTESAAQSDALDWSARTSPERAAAPAMPRAMRGDAAEAVGLPVIGEPLSQRVAAAAAAAAPQPRRRRLWSPAVVQAALGGAAAADALQAAPQQQEQQQLLQRQEEEHYHCHAQILRIPEAPAKAVQPQAVRRHTDLGPMPAAAAPGAGTLVRRATMPGGVPTSAADAGSGGPGGRSKGVAAMTLADVYREASGDPNPLSAGLTRRRARHGVPSQAAATRRPALRPLAAEIPALPAAATAARGARRGGGEQRGAAPGGPISVAAQRDRGARQPDQPARPGGGDGGDVAPATAAGGAAGAWQPARGANKYAQHWWFGGGNGDGDDGSLVDDSDVVAKARAPRWPQQQHPPYQQQQQQPQQQHNHYHHHQQQQQQQHSAGRAESVASDASYGSSVRHAVLAPPPSGTRKLAVGVRW